MSFPENQHPPELQRLISDAAKAEELCDPDELEEASRKYRAAANVGGYCDQPMVRYLTDDRDAKPDRLVELCILMGGNGDWYVGVAPQGQHPARMVRLCNSGGASRACPGLTRAIADAYRAIQNGEGT